MAPHLTEEIRSLIIKLTNKGKNNTDICKILNCSRYQIYRTLKAYDNDGRCLKKKTGTKPNKLNVESKEFIIDMIDENCSVTLKVIKQRLEENFNINVSISTISKVIGSFSYSFKRIHFIPVKRNSQQIIDSRYDYIIKLLVYLSDDPSKIFFLDETGYNVGMRALYGRSQLNTTPIKSVPQIRMKNFSMSCCVSRDEVIYSEISESPYNRNYYGSFLGNLFNVLNLKRLTNAVFVLDNVPFHKCEEIKNSFSAFGHTVIYLPPYSPFLNPIEETFSKMKSIVRRAEPMTPSELLSAINNSFSSITKEDLNGYFNHMKSYIDLCLQKENIEY